MTYIKIIVIYSFLTEFSIYTEIREAYGVIILSAFLKSLLLNLRKYIFY